MTPKNKIRSIHDSSKANLGLSLLYFHRNSQPQRFSTASLQHLAPWGRLLEGFTEVEVRHARDLDGRARNLLRHKSQKCGISSWKKQQMLWPMHLRICKHLKDGNQPCLEYDYIYYTVLNNSEDRNKGGLLGPELYHIHVVHTIP